MNGIPRKTLHRLLDDELDRLGYDDKIAIEHGHIQIQVNFPATNTGKYLIVKDRQTELIREVAL